MFPRVHPLSLALVLAGCSLADSDELTGDVLVDEDESYDASELGAQSLGSERSATLNLGVCEDARVVGQLTSPATPCDLGGDVLPDGWSATRLFEQGSPGVQGLGSAPGGLANFCAYEWTDPDPADLIDTPDKDVLYDALLLHDAHLADTLAPDCRGFSPQGVGLGTDTIGITLRDSFLSNIQAVDAADLAASSAARFPISVVVADTVSQYAALNPTVSPANDHGLLMGKLIRGITCPGSGAECLADQSVLHTMAMPRGSWYSDLDWQEGGRHGTPADLALAVYEAVGEWRALRSVDPGGSAPRVVVNLSLGYRRMLDDLPNEGKGPDLALRTALQYASCQGALVVAAAGNSDDPSCPGSDPLAPGSMESEPAPTGPECLSMGFVPLNAGQYPVFTPHDVYRPLVYAVGGVDEYDEPLVNARDDAHPRMAALGSNAIGGLTGSSSATAVTAGTAALLWSYRPSLRADQIMQAIYDAGYPLSGATADFWLDGHAMPTVHRLSVCAALDEVCVDPDPSKCPNLGCTAGPPAVDGNLAGYSSAVDLVLDASDIDVHVASAGTGPTCDGVDGNNLSDPQPDDPVCAHCNITVDANDSSSSSSAPSFWVNMTIAEEHYETAIENAILLVLDEDGTEWTFVLSQSVVASLNSQPTDIDVTSVLLTNLTSARAASLIFDLGDERSDEQITTERLPEPN